MKCLRCHQDNPPHTRFCLGCGKPAAGVAKSYADLKDELEGLRSSLTEALEQQAATSEILRAISSSPTVLQPVLDAIAESAARLCSAYDASVLRLEGAVLRVIAHHGPIPPGHVVPAIRGTVNGRAVLDRQAVHVADLQAERRSTRKAASMLGTSGIARS